MPSTDELNAGFDAAHAGLLRIVQTMVPNADYPFIGNVRTLALAKLQSPEMRPVILDEVKQVLVAAEKVRGETHL